MTHDKFCYSHRLGTGYCNCDDIAAARADEREQAAQRVNLALVKHFNEATPVVHIAVTAVRGYES